jgi:hypothetical protein
MKKILALARRGVGGEKATAEAMLQKLLAKYSMTVADLESEAQPVTRREFKYATEYERRLLAQIVAFVLGTRTPDLWRRRGKKILFAELTALQFAEVDVRYTSYRAALRKELDKATERVFSAFIHSNDLGVASNDDDAGASDVDMAELAAIMALMQTMRPIPIHRQIAA